MSNNNNINLELLNHIEKELSSFSKIIEKPSPDIWFCEIIENQLYGFVSCELNEEDINIPTISFSLSIRDITNTSRQQIIDLFSLNGKLHACSFSADVIDNKLILFINRRIMVSSYQVGELEANIYLMLNQLDVFSPEINYILENN